jgi:hypothetical protein
MRNFLGPRWSIVYQVMQQWSCCNQSPNGILLVVEPNYLLDIYVGMSIPLRLGVRGSYMFFGKTSL